MNNVDDSDELPPPDPGPSVPIQQQQTTYHQYQNLPTVPLTDEEKKFVVAVRAVRFGSFRAKNRGPMKIDSRKIQLDIIDDKNSNELHSPTVVSFLIALRHVVKIQYHMSTIKLGVLFINVTDYCATKIRNALRMVDNIDVALADGLPYFDPKSDHCCHKFVTVLLELPTDFNAFRLGFLRFFENTVEPKRVELMQQAGDRMHGRLEPLIDFMSYGYANELLSQTAAPHRRIITVDRSISTSKAKSNAVPYRIVPAASSDASELESPRQSIVYLKKPPAGNPFGCQTNVVTNPLIRRPLHTMTQKPLKASTQQPVKARAQHVVKAQPRQSVEVIHTTKAEVKTKIRQKQDGAIGRPVFIINNNIKVTTQSASASLSSGSTKNKDKPVKQVVVYNYLPQSGIKKPVTRAKTAIKRPAPTIHLTEDSPEPKCSRQSDSSEGERVLFNYSPNNKGGIPVHMKDLDCLNDAEFLNDTIIDFYLSYIVNELVPAERRDRIHVFSSFFWKRLTSTAAYKKHASVAAQTPIPADQLNTKTVRQWMKYQHVKTWTKKVDIFDKDYVIIPINEAAHWYLAIICFPCSIQPCQRIIADKTYSLKDQISKKTELKADKTDILKDQTSKKTQLKAKVPISISLTGPKSNLTASTVIKAIQEKSKVDNLKKPFIMLMDSLTVGTTQTQHYSTVSILREYLKNEWNEKKGQNLKIFDNASVTIKGFYPIVPQQDNWWDCGIFLLQYAEYFLEDPPTTGLMNKAVFKKWEDYFPVDNKRYELQELICKIARIQLPQESNKKVKTEHKFEERIREDGRQSVGPDEPNLSINEASVPPRPNSAPPTL